MTYRPAEPSQGILQYRQAIDSALTGLCGISYTDMVQMAPEMDRDEFMLKGGAARGLDPAAFASAFKRTHNLALAATQGAEWAASFNRARAAIVAFATGARGWRLGTDGRGHKSCQDGRALRLDVANRHGDWGFAVSESGGRVVLMDDAHDSLGRVIPPEAVYQKLSARIDIGEAVSDAVRLRANRTATMEHGPQKLAISH